MKGKTIKTLFMNILVGIFVACAIIILLELVLFVTNYHYYPGYYDTFELDDRNFRIVDEGVYANVKFMLLLDIVPIFGKDSVMLKEKTSDEYRIFLVGGSAADGLSPYLNNLKLKLEEKYPQKNFTIVNFAIPSTGTFRIMQYYPDFFIFEPDLIIVHSGNNECLEAEYANVLEIRNQKAHQTNHFLLVHSRAYQFLSQISLKMKITLARIHPFFISPLKDVPSKESLLGNSNYSFILNKYSANLMKMYDIASIHDTPVLYTTVTYNRLFLGEDNMINPQKGYELFVEGKSQEAIHALDYNRIGFDCPYTATTSSNDVVAYVAKQTNSAFADVDKAVVENYEPFTYGFEYFVDHCHYAHNYDIVSSMMMPHEKDDWWCPEFINQTFCDIYLEQIRNGTYDTMNMKNIFDVWTDTVFETIVLHNVIS